MPARCFCPRDDPSGIVSGVGGCVRYAPIFKDFEGFWPRAMCNPVPARFTTSTPQGFTQSRAYMLWGHLITGIRCPQVQRALEMKPAPPSLSSQHFPRYARSARRLCPGSGIVSGVGGCVRSAQKLDFSVIVSAERRSRRKFGFCVLGFCVPVPSTEM